MRPQSTILSSIRPHPQTKPLTEHAPTLRRGKATYLPTSTPTTSACEYNKKSRQKPCAHSVPRYVLSFPPLHSTEHSPIRAPRTTSPPRRSATSKSCAANFAPPSNQQGSSHPLQTQMRASLSPNLSCSRRSCSPHCTRASRALRCRQMQSNMRAWRAAL